MQLQKQSQLPLDGKCRKSSIVYKACLLCNIANNYYGCCETEFKARFNNHSQSFKYQRKSNTTELSKAFWQAKDAGKNPRIKWSIVALILFIKHAYYQATLPTIIMVVVKRSSKPVSITIAKALNTRERVTPPNSPKLFGRPRTQEKPPA